MANKRVYQIAKELGVAAQAVVDKCRAEGIPATVLKGHQSTISIGLEATIREWFSPEAEGDGGGTATAVETSAKVDLESVRAKTKPKAKAKAKAKPAEPKADRQTAVEDASVGDAPALPAATAAAPTKAASPAQVSIAPPAPISAPPPTPPQATTVSPAAPLPPKADDGGRAPSAEPTEPAPEPVMNVPTRPKVVTPAGPQLKKQTPVRLSGPKVVRVEAPENVAAPRPKRGPAFGGGPGGPSRGGGGVSRGTGTGEGESADARSRRRTGRGSTRRRDRGVEFDMPSSSFTEQDLAEREARLTHAGGFLKKRRQQAKRSGSPVDRATPAESGGRVTIAAPFTIKDLSSATGVKGADIVKKLFLQGVMANINSGIDPEKAQEIMMDYDIELDVVEAKSAEDVVSEQFESRELIDERARGPVVTILGHVDHGKTSLLDKIRHANVAAGEAGGITQATSAFRVPVKTGDKEKFVVFIDTPGHQAFTEMRSRGANITDICVIVVAADDGVMPQTIESISHAKAAGTPIIIALNKIDKPEATDSNIQRILGQLAEHELNPTEWGGDTEVIKTSAATGVGIQDLLDVLDYQAELLELKADHKGPAQGTVIEAKTEEGRGSVASILVQQGKLEVGNFIVMGRAFGRVRDITTDKGEKVKEALPPAPVLISGIDEIPDAGDKFFVVDSLRKAQEAAEQRRHRDREAQLAQPKVTLDSLFTQISEAAVKEILVVLKADVQGSVDVIKNEIEKIETDEVKCRVLHSAVGGITESDVQLAEASKAIIVGFNVIPSGKARTQADAKGVEIRSYRVIYDITDDLKKAAEGLLAPELREEVKGHAEVRQVFRITRVGSIAGCYITDGTIERNAYIRVTRGDIVIEHDRVLEQLKRFKDDVKEVRSGQECGMKIVGYDDIKEGDILECYKKVEVKRSL